MRSHGRTIVTTNGCFDLLHVGHLRYLEWAKRQGDILIVGINSDASVRGNKGPSRPINPARERAEIVAALRAVDATFIFNESTPTRWLAKVKPDVHVKGADRSMREIVERHVVKRGGGKVTLAPYVKDRSTTNIIRRVKEH
ncbi:adenylyltransferase/cytidyltransferase family protein [Candidatus Kaiserbacteria bacterium]|nr:adenylyltransferase/cytidyltransferase family protein [Candidatus Kaiserbacteria bacterium]